MKKVFLWLICIILIGLPVVSNGERVYSEIISAPFIGTQKLTIDQWLANSVNNADFVSLALNDVLLYYVEAEDDKMSQKIIDTINEALTEGYIRIKRLYTSTIEIGIKGMSGHTLELYYSFKTKELTFVLSEDNKEEICIDGTNIDPELFLERFQNIRQVLLDIL